MSLPQSIKIFLKQLPIKNMKGDEIFAAIVFFLAGGKKDVEILIGNVKKNWSKTLIGKTYNSGFAYRAQGFVDSRGKGTICLTGEGVEFVESLGGVASTHATGLVVFAKGSTHSFDKFLRTLFKNSKKDVYVVDAYVSGNIFDNLLDEVSKTVPIKFLYGNDLGGFAAKSTRFAKEYSFIAKENKQFHDRFVIVDSIGYIIGPSLKDAADKKPATVVILNSPDSKKLVELFANLWNEK